VQISVVVANIQARSLRAEAEKGFARTAIGRELADPKPEINFEEGTIGARFASKDARAPSARSRHGEREVGQNSDVRIRGFGGGASDLGDVGRPPGKSFLFFLTTSTGLESPCAAAGPKRRKSASPFRSVRSGSDGP